jgi:hypothetical protein
MSVTPDASPPAPATPASAWTPPPSAPPAPKPKMNMGIVVAVVVVVVAAVVLAGLFAAGVGPFHLNNSGAGGGGGGGGGSGSPQTYSQAAATAQPTTTSIAGGPWTLAGGVGVVTPTSEAVNTTTINATLAGGLCQPHFLSTASSLTSIPSTSTSAASGAANTWVIWFANSTVGIAEVAVFGGVATPVLTVGVYAGCSVGASGVSLPSDSVNSPAATAAAWSSGGSAFTAAYASYDLEDILVPSVTLNFGGKVETSAASWEITYTTCNLGAEDGTTLAGEPVAQFTASLNATTGTLIRGLNATEPCSGSGGGGGGGKPTFASVEGAFVASQQHRGGTYWDNAPLITSLDALTTGDLTANIENGMTNATFSTAGMTREVVNGTNFVVYSVYNFTTHAWNDTSVTVGAGFSTNSFTLISPIRLKGVKFVLTATAAAPVTGSVSTTI